MRIVITVCILILSLFVGAAVFSAYITATEIGLNDSRERSAKPLLNGIGLGRLGFSHEDLDFQESGGETYQNSDSTQGEVDFDLLRESLYESFNLRSDQLQSLNPLDYGSEFSQEWEKPTTKPPSASNVKLFFGTLPFVSFPLPVGEEGREDRSFISPDSVFVFWYLKKSF